MVLCDQPALTSNQFDECPLSITRWNLLLRKLYNWDNFPKIGERGLARAESHIFIMRIHISSGPWAFRMLRDFISLIMSSCSNDTDESLELVFHRPGQIARPKSIGYARACKTFEVRPIFRALRIWLVKKREQIYKFLVK